MKKSFKISIIIPIKNGEATLDGCVQGIVQQSLFEHCEIIAIDSGSTDGTLNLLKKYPVRVVQIAAESFNHGATRNLGVQQAAGEFVVMTVQDAVPSSKDWLEIMLKHFSDPEVAGVCGQQIVPHHKNKNPHEWFRPQSEPAIRAVQFKAKNDFDKLSPKEKRDCCGWDDVNAMYRKSILIEQPFQPVMFGEDMFWAKEALEKGYKLVYDTSSKVDHYHFQFPEYTYKRTLIAHLFMYECFQYIRSDPYTSKDYLLIVYRNFQWNCHPKWIVHNFMSIYNFKKALKVLNKHIQKGTVEDLKKAFSLNIPIGKQK